MQGRWGGIGKDRGEAEALLSLLRLEQNDGWITLNTKSLAYISKTLAVCTQKRKSKSYFS
jgi:hypothetical protein